MNRELIVKLLKKNIDDLILLTDGFEEMTSFPRALIHLAQLKTNEIKEYLYELSELKAENSTQVVVESTLPPADATIQEEKIEVENELLTANSTDEELVEVESEISVTIEEDVTEKDSVISATTEEEEIGEDKVISAITQEEAIMMSGSPGEELVEVESEINRITEEYQIEEVNVISATSEADAIVMSVTSEEVSEDVKPIIMEQPAESIPVQVPIIQSAETTKQEEIPTESTAIQGQTALPAAHFQNGEINEDRKVTLGEKLATGITRNELHSNREADRFSNSLANKKIDDIRQAINIADRFRFQRELFRNNGEEMNKMLNYINLLASFQEIETFLQKKYGWSADNQAAQDLYAIVRRKFITY